MTELLHKEEVYAIVGAAMEVYNELGSGFLEPVYQEALEREFALRSIPFESQKGLPIHYKDSYRKHISPTCSLSKRSLWSSKHLIV